MRVHPWSNSGFVVSSIISDAVDRHSLGIREPDTILYEMGMKEKEHEVYFLQQIEGSRLLPFFEKIFSWGSKTALNDVDLKHKCSVEDSHRYCQTSREPK